MRANEIMTELPDNVSDEEKGMETPTTDIKPIPHEDFAEIEVHPRPADVKKAFLWSAVIIVIISIIIPIPLGASTYIFSTGFFTAYLVVAMVSTSKLHIHIIVLNKNQIFNNRYGRSSPDSAVSFFRYGRVEMR